MLCLKVCFGSLKLNLIYCQCTMDFQDGCSGESTLSFYQLGNTAAGIEITFCITINCDFTWNVSFCGTLIDKQGYSNLKEFDFTINSGLNTINQCSMCSLIVLIFNSQLINSFSLLVQVTNYWTDSIIGNRYFNFWMCITLIKTASFRNLVYNMVDSIVL